MEKILVRVYVPMIDKVYDLWIPVHRKIYNVILLLIKAVNELNDGNYKPAQMPMLYDKLTAEIYDLNLSVKETNIRSGTELVLI